MLDLTEKRNTRYRRLSGGQKQRLSIALALIGRPRIAILDELTTGLDPVARRDSWRLIDDIRNTGVTIMLITHLMIEAERLCDRVAIMRDGRIVALGTPAALGRPTLEDAFVALTDRRCLMKMLKMLTLTEARLLLREPLAFFWGVAFPMVLLTVMGLSASSIDGVSLVAIYEPIVIAFISVAFGVQGIPVQIAGYRQGRILRRLATTPAGPARVIGAQLIVSLGVIFIATIGVLLVGRLGFGVPLPRQPSGIRPGGGAVGRRHGGDRAADRRARAHREVGRGGRDGAVLPADVLRRAVDPADVGHGQAHRAVHPARGGHPGAGRQHDRRLAAPGRARRARRAARSPARAWPPGSSAGSSAGSGPTGTAVA